MATIVDPSASDLGTVRVECHGIEIPGGAPASFSMTCDLSCCCDLSYAADQVKVYPGGFENLGTKPVSSSIELAAQASGRPPKAKVVVKKDGDAFLVEILEAGEVALEIEGLSTCGSGSEASISTTFVGVARTPGAGVTHAAAVSAAGADPSQAVVVESLRAAVHCTISQEFLE